MDSHNLETWMSILEYCDYKGKSISTVRRYIKSNNLIHKQVEGKYYILVKNFKSKIAKFENSDRQLEDLNAENKKLKIENQELKMLIDLYEDKLNLNFTNKNQNNLRQ